MEVIGRQIETDGKMKRLNRGEKRVSQDRVEIAGTDQGLLMCVWRGAFGRSTAGEQYISLGM